MPIDFSRFTEDKEIICPIVDGSGQYEGRKLEFNVADGWYRIKLGNQPSIVRPATELEKIKEYEKKKRYIGFQVGDKYVPSTFEITKPHTSIRVHLSPEQTDTWSPTWFFKHSDGRFYFAGENPSYNRTVIQAIRDCFNRRVGIREVPGVTPELRLTFILSRLYQNSYDAFRELQDINLTGRDREEYLKNYKQNFGERIRDVVTDAGGTYISYSKRGSGYLVEWEVGGQTVKSVINDDMRILDAGFCLSGADKKHSMSSIVMLARMFQDDAPLYIERE